MTTNPNDEPQVPGTPPPSAPAYGAPSSPPPGATPPPAYGAPPAGAYNQPPAGGYPPPAPSYGAPMQPPLSEAEQRQWAMFAHIGGILLWFIAPLVIWLMYKERGRFVEEQAKEALNFQIFHIIVQFALWIVVAILTVVTFGIGGLLSFLNVVVAIVAVVFMIMAGIAANKGEAYRYPVNLRLIK